MAGSTEPMQSRLPDNGEVIVTYTGRQHGSTWRWRILSTWWPIEQDYFIDDYQFRRPGPLPMLVDLATGSESPGSGDFQGRRRPDPRWGGHRALAAAEFG